LSSLTPTRLFGPPAISGLVCAATTGEPIVNATITVVSDLGTTASVNSERVDDRGFFFSDLRPWAPKPKFLKISAQLCPTQLLGIGDPLSSPKTCLAAAMFPGQNLSQWTLTCGL